MVRKPQKRTLQTHENLLNAARDAVTQHGYGGARVDDIVARASVAKGTFFAHFRDKDALMDVLIGADLSAVLDAAEAKNAPETVNDLIEALAPLHDAMTCERYVFDIVIRYSGALGQSDIGPIAMIFSRYIDVVEGWVRGSGFRNDIPERLVAEGVQAFAVQAMALTFCALHQEASRDARLAQYLAAWLTPA
ncbi:MAG: TetR/AcrR family transcriptional regulator [Pseudomonadota bacterium]